MSTKKNQSLSNNQPLQKPKGLQIKQNAPDQNTRSKVSDDVQKVQNQPLKKIETDQPKKPLDKKSQESLWAELHIKLPWQNDTESKKRRDNIWRQFDVNGNGYLSLAEIDRAIQNLLKLPELFALKPVTMRAWQAARTKVPSTTKHGNDYVTKNEFPYLLKYLRQYYEYWVAFDRIDSDDDRRITKQEFIQSAPIMKNWGLDISNPDQLWKEADKDKLGMILFNEFVDWAIKKNLDLEDDDNLDKDGISQPQSTVSQVNQPQNIKPAIPEKTEVKQQQKPESSVTAPLKQGGLPPSSKSELWIELHHKLPWQQTPEAIKRRNEIWSQFDINGNGCLTLSEIQTGLRNVLKLPGLFALKKVIMRAYQASRIMLTSSSLQGKDYVTKGEFRYLLKYLRQYYEYWVAFELIDSDHDNKISKQEFLKAVPVMKNWGLDVSNSDQQWREADQDGSGKVSFHEFADWAIRKNLDLDDDDNQDLDKNFQTQTSVNQPNPAQSKPTVSFAKSQEQQKAVTKKSRVMDEKSKESLWAELHNKLPWQNDTETKKRRDGIWRQIDVNGNGYLSLAEIDHAMQNILQLPELFALKPVTMRAWQAARTKVPSITKNGSDYVTKNEFPYLLKYLRQYYEYWVAFDRIDSDFDRRITKQEFLQAVPIMKNWGLDMQNPDQIFREADKDNAGMILFDEFLEWAIIKNLDLIDYDNKDDEENSLKKTNVNQLNTQENKTQRAPVKSELVQLQKPETNIPTPAQAGAQPNVVLNVSEIEKPKKDLKQIKDPDWVILRSKLTYKNEQELMALLKKFDNNFNGKLSFQEVEYAIKYTLKLPVQFQDKTVILTAFNHSKSHQKQDYITKSEFRLLISNLKRFYSYWYAFKQLDKSQDYKVSKIEFIKAAPLMKQWDINTNQIENEWRKADTKNFGEIDFQEFCIWAKNANMRLEDDPDDQISVQKQQTLTNPTEKKDNSQLQSPKENKKKQITEFQPQIKQVSQDIKLLQPEIKLVSSEIKELKLEIKPVQPVLVDKDPHANTLDMLKLMAEMLLNPQDRDIHEPQFKSIYSKLSQDQTLDAKTKKVLEPLFTNFPKIKLNGRTSINSSNISFYKNAETEQSKQGTPENRQKSRQVSRGWKLRQKYIDDEDLLSGNGPINIKFNTIDKVTNEYKDKLDEDYPSGVSLLDKMRRPGPRTTSFIKGQDDYNQSESQSLHRMQQRNSEPQLQQVNKKRVERKAKSVSESVIFIEKPVHEYNSELKKRIPIKQPQLQIILPMINK